MFPNSPIFPPVSSKLAPQVDALFLFMLGGSIVFSLLIVTAILVFIVKYRRRSEDEVGVDADEHSARLLELTWTLIPLALLMLTFGWGVKIFFFTSRPPANAAQFYVVGKQWMWKVEHPEGRREINELHVPVGMPVKLTMTSEDVIHNFSIPAFRLKMDVLPGRYTTSWFQATQEGTYHIFCDQYCGVDHAKMVGTVTVLSAEGYAAWLAGKGSGVGQGTVATGAELFVSKACNTCHRPDSSARAPILDGIFGKPVRLLDGAQVTADETYVRESIVSPSAKVVQGYQPIMPTFKDQLSEEELIQLVKYVKSLSPEASSTATATATVPATGSPK